MASGGGDGKIHIEDYVIVPSEGVAGGEIRNIEQVAKSKTEAVAQIEKKLSIKIHDIYTGISGQHIRCARNSYYVYVGRDGEICQEDVQRLVESMNNVQAPEGSRILHMSAQSYVVNDREEVSDPVGMFGNKLEGTFNFILADNEHVSRLERVMERVGLRQQKLFINALATADAVVLPDEKELGVAVVDIGAGTTDLCIYHDNTVRYISVIPIGADAINKDIRSWGILERYVEELKVNYGSAMASGVSDDRKIKVPGRTPREPKEISFRNLASIIEARMKDIADYVMAEIRASGYEKKLGAGIVLTGGGAGLKDIDKFFHEYTGMDVRVASPDVRVDEPSLESAADYRLSTVLGIVLGALESDTDSRIERRITSAAGTAAPPAGSAPSDTGKGKGGRKGKYDAIDDDTSDDVPEPRAKKGSPLGRLFGKVNRMFDVIDDDSEI